MTTRAIRRKIWDHWAISRRNDDLLQLPREEERIDIDQSIDEGSVREAGAPHFLGLGESLVISA
ncbi:hypothetical protein ACFL39_01245, partial [Gemmatimonadota bacterium]